MMDYQFRGLILFEKDTTEASPTGKGRKRPSGDSILVGHNSKQQNVGSKISATTVTRASHTTTYNGAPNANSCVG